MTDITPPTHDDSQEVRGNEQGTKGHRFGNEYDSHEHRMPAEVGVGTEGSGHADGGVGIDTDSWENALKNTLSRPAGVRATRRSDSSITGWWLKPARMTCSS